LKKVFNRLLSAYSQSDLDLQLKARFFLVLSLMVIAIILLLTVVISIVQYFTLGYVFTGNIVLLIGGVACGLNLFLFLMRGHFFLSAHLLVLIVILMNWSALIIDPGEPVARLDSFIYIICLIGLLPLIIQQHKSVIFLYGAINIAFLLVFFYYFRPVLPISDYELFDFLCDSTLAVFAACVIAAGVFGINDTAVKRAKAEIREREKIEENRGRLEAQLSQVQKMEALGQLAGGVAHDFNNMLSAVIANTELILAQQELDDNGREQMEGIRYTANRSAALIRQLLAFARRQPAAPEMIDINQAVSEMIPMLNRLIREDIRLQWLPGDLADPIVIDPSQMDQILTNLVVNARDAIPGQGHITVETGAITLDESFGIGEGDTASGAYIMLAVSDNGCGMDKEVQNHIFDPFFSTKKETGTGLGLATIYGILKQNNGLVKVYSEPGQGTTFKLFFPAIEIRGSIREAEIHETEVLPQGTETILMVEDDPAVLRFCTTALEQLGYTVMAEGAPEKSLALVKSGQDQIDLLLTDVSMPGMNGPELARQIRKIIPDIRCMYTSGYPANVIIKEYRANEGGLFLSKPFTIKSLAAKVREALA